VRRGKARVVGLYKVAYVWETDGAYINGQQGRMDQKVHWLQGLLERSERGSDGVESKLNPRQK